MILQIFFAFLGSLCFSILFNVDKKEVVLCGVSGGVCWLVYLLFTQYFNMSAVSGVFIASAIITALARFLANTRKNPITIFLIPAIIPLVPGSGIYYTMYNLIISQNLEAALMGVETLKTAGAIAIGIIVVLSLPRCLFKIEKVF